MKKPTLMSVAIGLFCMVVLLKAESCSSCDGTQPIFSLDSNIQAVYSDDTPVKFAIGPNDSILDTITFLPTNRKTSFIDVGNESEAECVEFRESYHVEWSAIDDDYTMELYEIAKWRETEHHELHYHFLYGDEIIYSIGPLELSPGMTRGYLFSDSFHHDSVLYSRDSGLLQIFSDSLILSRL